MTTTPRDPVQDLINMAARGGFEKGRLRPTWGICLKWFVVGWVVGIATVVGWAQAQTVPPAAEQYRRDLTRISQSVWGLNAPISLLAAQIQQESGWRHDAVSRVGASGLTQFMPATARDVGERYGVRPVNTFDPKWAMHAQSVYMKELYAAVQAVNESERYAFALSAYNGGLGRVRQRQRLSEDPGRCFNATCDINPGISEGNQRENREYPRRIILTLMSRYHSAGWGGPAIHKRYLGD